MGDRSITLINDDLGVKKRLKVRIAEGKTTRVVQDLLK